MAELLHFPKLFKPAERDGEPPQQGVFPFLMADRPADLPAEPERDRQHAIRPSLPPTDTLDLPDPEARRAALDIRRSWIVEAPAGSGKTGLLIQRFLKLLAFGDLHRPSEVLAITFTRKAAGELRSRVLEQLGAAAAGTALPEGAGAYEQETRDLAVRALARDRTLGWNLLANPHSLNISTIDAFCADLAGGQPLLSAGAGRYRPLDNPSELYELAAERAVRQLGGTQPSLHEALRCLLLHRDGEIGDTVQLVAGMLGEREQWGEIVPFAREELTDAILDGEVRPRLEASLSRAICAGLSHAADALGPDLLDELTQFAASMAHEPGLKGLSPLHICSGLTKAPRAAAEELDHWRSLLHLVLTGEGGWRRRVLRGDLHFEIPKPAQERLRALIADLQASDDRQGGRLRAALCQVRDLPPAFYPEDQWRVVKALFRVLRHALAELKVLFSERGECDFPEIALTARQLLRSESDLLASPGTQLSHLLVDEMQDTSSGQYELFELLSRSWDGATQTVFLVGDPKQSIYLFRQARVARFLRTQATGLLAEVHLGALRLTANFRSQAHLVDDFNATFEQVLAPGGAAGVLPELQIPFVAATPTRSGTTRPALQWHARLQAGDDRTRADSSRLRSEAAAADAGEIRAVIEDFRSRWHDRACTDRRNGPAFPRIAVLARSRAHLAPVVAELRRDRGAGALPFRAVDTERLDERQEVLDLLALTRALLHPGDRTAWMAVLRSPVCGLSLGDLLILVGEGEEAQSNSTVAHLVATRQHLLSKDGLRALARAWPVLQSAEEVSGRTDLPTLVERTWRSLGADAFLGTGERSNARRYFQLLRKLDASSELVTVDRIMRGLGRLYAEPLAGEVAVELMTIHKAKGLEWDLVIVPALDRRTGDNRHELLKWLELDGAHGEEAEVILSPISGKGEASSRLSAWLGKAQAAREASETKRLLYVACTRAREELHLFAACDLHRDGSLSEPAAGTLLHAAWPAAQPILQELLRTGSDLDHEEEPAATSDAAPFPLSLAAAGEAVLEDRQAEATNRFAQPLLRLPKGFDPLERFRTPLDSRLPYPDPGSLRHGATFRRPEGSFAARAFGNVVHRFLDWIAERRVSGVTEETLRAEALSWESRILASFRAEGLPPALCLRETERALQALHRTLHDVHATWILAPHTSARSEYALQCALQVDDAQATESGGVLRADRTFLGGAGSLTTGETTHLWIVDFKTAEPGGRSLDSFLDAERRKYGPQMRAYARAMLSRPETPGSVMLALFYPLIPHLLYWPYVLENASDDLNAGYR